jgi:ketosteroid isomerase-like protein
MGAERNIADALESLLQAFNDHDLNQIMAHFAENCVLEMPRGPHRFGARCNGKTDVRNGLASRFEGLPDVHYGEDKHYVCGNTGISKWRLTGTTPQGKKIDVNGCDFYEFEDGKAILKDAYWKIIE